MSGLSGVATTSNGAPWNGAIVAAYSAARFFGAVPEDGDPVPDSGSPDAGPVTAGTHFGAHGAWHLDGLAAGDYYVVTSTSTIYLTGPSQPRLSSGQRMWTQRTVGITKSVAAGPISSRPTSSGSGDIYLATDVGPAPGTMYIDTGSWQVIGGSVELASAESTTNFTTTSTTAVDVTGMSMSFTAGDRPFDVEMSVQCQNNTVGDGVIVQVVESVNGGAYSIINLGGAIPGIGQTGLGVPIDLKRRRSFARGTTLAYKLQAYAVTGGTATVFAASTNPMGLYARQI